MVGDITNDEKQTISLEDKSSKLLKQGSRIRLKNVANKKEYNGKYAVILRKINEKGRYHVKLEECGTEMAIYEVFMEEDYR